MAIYQYTRIDISLMCLCVGVFVIFPPAPDAQDVCLHVGNTLYQETIVANRQYVESGPTEAQKGNIYDMATPTDEDQASPYEAPLPLGSKQWKVSHIQIDYTK